MTESILLNPEESTCTVIMKCNAVLPVKHTDIIQQKYVIARYTVAHKI